jgi:tRNA-splicing ligase RtcB
MIGAKDLNAAGLPHHREIMPMALKLANVAVSSGEIRREEVLERIGVLALSPETVAVDDVFSPLARTVLKVLHGGCVWKERAEPAPWRQWGNIGIDETCVRQMENACRLPIAASGALMPDAHAGYGLPIGGVLAVENAVIPYAVGVDIACRMRLSILDMPLSYLASHRDWLAAALETRTRFGVGAAFDKGERREHPVMDEDWNISRETARIRDKAWKQLGTSGGGNHFAGFGELCLEKPDLGLEAGAYLALLSHSGSRGAGETIASHFSGLAMKLRPWLPGELRHLAWLDMSDDAGREYWAAMELMGRYASANHDLIHEHVLGCLGAQALAAVENHHNFAEYLAARGVKLLSGGLDEAPAAYKDINAVIAAQADLLDVVAAFTPRLVKMAPEERGSRRFKKARR